VSFILDQSVSIDEAAKVMEAKGASSVLVKFPKRERLLEL